MEDGRTASDPGGISFRALRASDLPLVHRWFNMPHVGRWWYGEGTSYQEVEGKYLSYIGGGEPVEPFLILHKDTLIGYIQGYGISHDEDHAALVGIENAAGMDLFIGEPGYLYRGLGGPILRRFLAERVFSDPSIRVCVIGPEPGNATAIRAYEKVGFRFFRKLRVPGEPEPEYPMKLTGREFEAGHHV